MTTGEFIAIFIFCTAVVLWCALYFIHSIHERAKQARSHRESRRILGLMLDASGGAMLHGVRVQSDRLAWSIGATCVSPEVQVTPAHAAIDRAILALVKEANKNDMRVVSIEFDK